MLMFAFILWPLNFMKLMAHLIASQKSECLNSKSLRLMDSEDEMIQILRKS